MTYPALRNALHAWFVEAADLSSSRVTWEIEEEPPADPPSGTMRIVSVGPLDPAPADYDGFVGETPLRVTGVDPGEIGSGNDNGRSYLQFAEVAEVQ